jgi:hypothetical protein
VARSFPYMSASLHVAATEPDKGDELVVVWSGADRRGARPGECPLGVLMLFWI